MSSPDTTNALLLILAKAPEPGRVKTRLCPPATPEQAAELAAAALLDTLRAARAVAASRTAVAICGRLGRARRTVELQAALRGVPRLAQRGGSLGERIAAAHLDGARLLPGRPSLQTGMDTPQADSQLLAESFRTLAAPGVDAVLGPADDGGWWALGLRDPRAAHLLTDVPTSCPDTGEQTLAALRAAGLRVALLPELTDVDTAADAVAVAATIPDSRFAAAVAAAGLRSLGRLDTVTGAAR